MHLSPAVYNYFIRPKCSVKKYIEDVITAENTFTGKSVLDFACGTGDIAYIFDSERYLGVDIDSKRIEYASDKYPQYNFSTLENHTIPASNQQFDHVVIIAALHHISDTDILEYIPEFKRVLKDGGVIIGIEPCKTDKKSFSNWYMDIVDDGRHIRNEKEYKSLYGKDFQFRPQKYFRKFLFYRELYYTATLSY